MVNGNRKKLAQYRLTEAIDCLKTAESNFAIGMYKAAANRSYYCIFQCMRAVLALDGFDSKKHSGIISAFRQKHIKTGDFDSSLSDMIEIAFNIRNSSDYEDYYVLEEEETVQQIENARAFLQAITDYFG